jgi:radical SAM protein with 4Fe4S-binding SPASM domain
MDRGTKNIRQRINYFLWDIVDYLLNCIEKITLMLFEIKYKRRMEMETLVPKQIDIEVTSACNLKCRFCPGLETETKHMDFELFKSIIDRVNFPTTIVPWLNGEPLLHPRYNEMLALLNEKKLRYYVTTNGMIYKPDVYNLLTDKKSSCYQVIFSLDGVPGSKSVELARPGTVLSHVFKNINTMLELKKVKKSKLDIAVKICRRGQDWAEIEEYISYWLKYGVDFVVVGDALVENENPKGFRRYPCQYSDNNFMVIKSDGRLVRCAYNDLATNTEKFSFGRVDKTTPLLDIYNNKDITKFRKDQNKGTYQEPCDTCGMSYTGMGFQGEVQFRNPELIQMKIYHQRDYYNSFFSLKRKWKKPEYYKPGFKGVVK